MKDWNPVIRSAYIKILKANQPAYFEMAPDPVQVGKKFFLVHSISGVDDSDKNSFDGRVSVTVDCVVNANDGTLNIKDCEAMAGYLKDNINSSACPDMSPDFKCLTTKITFDQSFNNLTGTNKVYRRLIRYEHIITQIT